MPLENFIIWVFCWIDDSLRGITLKLVLRQRGFLPSLTDSEVVTMEIVGEFLGIDTDKGIWRYFHQHWHDWFPCLGSRANFAKQAANLWAIKQKILAQLSNDLGSITDPIHIIDGFPIPVCSFRRANRSQIFRGEATYGYCAAKGETYYGFHGHLLIDFKGAFAGFALTPANANEREALWELVDPIKGLLLGDKGYIDQILRKDLDKQDIFLETPLRSNMKDPRDPGFVCNLMSIRRLIETVIGQLTTRFNIEKIWARDLWHLTNRLTRKILSHALCVFMNIQLKNEPLQLDELVLG